MDSQWPCLNESSSDTLCVVKQPTQCQKPTTCLRPVTAANATPPSTNGVVVSGWCPRAQKLQHKRRNDSVEFLLDSDNNRGQDRMLLAQLPSGHCAAEELSDETTIYY